MKVRLLLVLAALFGYLAIPLPLYFGRGPEFSPRAERDLRLVDEATAALHLAQPPVTPAEAADARAEVRQEVRSLSRGRREYRFQFPDGSVVEFTDRPRRPGEGARRRRVVVFTGTMPAAEERETFLSAARRTGNPPAAATALQFVSTHEGGFDAINTWDHARFSWGFIQFAGGRGLRPLLGHFKGQDPELFRRHLGRYGVDVLPDRDGDPRPVCVDPESGDVLRGDAAETAYGDDPLLIALFIRAGRDREVQRLQVETAFNEYVSPALSARSSGVLLADVLSSTKGLAMLIDRKIHEGNVGRIARAFRAVRTAVVDLEDLERVERQVLRRAVRDAFRRSAIIGRRLREIYRSDLPGPA